MQNRYAALVEGARPRFSRADSCRLIPACYAVAIARHTGDQVAKPPLWFGGSELGGLLLAAATLLLVLATRAE